MKQIKIFLLSLASSVGALAADITVSPGQLESLISGGIAKNETELKIKGNIDARDLAALENLSSEIKTLNLSDVRIESLVTPGRKYFGRTLFAEGEIPPFTFFKSEVENIVLPSNTRIVGEGAFAATSIKSIVIPEGVSQLGDYTFYGCANLKEISLPSSLEKIGKGAFSGCTALAKADLSASTITDIPENAFAGDANLATILLPRNIESVGREAFSHTKISSLNLSTVKSFESYALSGMPFLESLSINPDAEINDGLLMDNISLASLTGLPDYIPDYFAANCSTLPAQSASHATGLGKYSFANTLAPGELVLSGFIRRIDRGALSGLSNISRIDVTALEDAVPEADELAFEGLTPSEITLLVSDKSMDVWKAHPVWGQFNIVGSANTSVQGVGAENSSAIMIALRGSAIVIEAPTAISDVRIYTTDGRVAYVASPGESRVEIETAQLPSGVVVVSASDSEGNIRNLSILIR